MGMRVLVIGGGGREHALVWKLRQSPQVDAIFSAPGNAGTAQLGENAPIQANDFAGLLRFAKENRIDLTVVGPDDPLGDGLVDEFKAAGFCIFGPCKAAARLEASKVFAKQLMRRAGIPTAMAGVFDDSRKGCEFAEKLHYPVVIKADGLAAGKGVIVAQDVTSACEAIRDMIERGRFGKAGRQVLIEEFLAGWECSVHALVSGDQYQMLGTACDHKRLRDGDEGPNTGGMGAYSPPLHWDDALQEQFQKEVMRNLLRDLQDQRIHFSGLLFPGLMIRSGVPYVLEFNCRFGDPETQVILPRLQSDLVDLITATIDAKLEDLRIEIDPRPAVTVVMASAGYPGKIDAGKVITGLDEAAKLKDVHVFHAGTRVGRDGIETSGGRVLAVTALGQRLDDARERAYQAVQMINFEACYYRRDIALGALTDKLAPTDVALRSEQ